MKRFTWIDAFIILLFILSVYLVLTRIFGHSATDITIAISLFLFLGGLLYNLNREFGEFEMKTIHSFERLKQDMQDIKSVLVKKK